MNENTVISMALAPRDPAFAMKCNSVQCAACFKHFTSESNLERHMRNAEVCRSWIEHAAAKADAPDAMDAVADVQDATDAVPQAAASPRQLLTGTLMMELLAGKPGSSVCVGCGREFSSHGCLTRHYKCSVVCDRVRARRVVDELLSSVADFGEMAREGMVKDQGRATRTWQITKVRSRAGR